VSDELIIGPFRVRHLSYLGFLFFRGLAERPRQETHRRIDHGPDLCQDTHRTDVTPPAFGRLAARARARQTWLGFSSPSSARPAQPCRRCSTSAARQRGRPTERSLRAVRTPWSRTCGACSVGRQRVAAGCA